MRIPLWGQILVALALAFAIGAFATAETTLLGVNLLAVFDFLGTAFLNALKMIIVPLIVSSIIVGIAGIGSGSAVGRLGTKTLAYYMTTSTLAILIGLTVVNVVQPGLLDGQPAKDVLGLSDDKADAARERIGDKGAGDIPGVFLSMIPPNIVAAAADGQMLGLIFFSLLYGFFMARIGEPYSGQQFRFWQGVFSTMMEITRLVMKFAPIGVFALVAETVTSIDKTQIDELAASLGLFFVSVLLALSLHALVVLPALLRFVGRVNPLRHYRAMAEPMLTAFSTASSSATLPLTMTAVEQKAGVSNRTTSFVLPLGATVNMDGTALYECVAAMYIAQAYGLELTLATQFTVVLIALLTSIGVAGIPSASLVAITIILTAIGLPLEAVGLILAVDRILDMFRTAVNVFSDSCGAVIIARLEGEENILTDDVAARTAGPEPEAAR